MSLGHIIAIISSGFDTYLYLILFILIFLEEAGVPLPLPGDVYVFLAGAQVVKGNAHPLFVLIDVVAASLCGSSVLFLLVKYKGEPLIEKYGKYILISNTKLEKGKSWFARFGEIVVLVGRWIPGLRIVLTIVAGIFELDYYKFVIAILVSSICWATAFLLAGMGFGKHLTAIILFFKHIAIYYGYIFYVLSMIGILLLVYFLSRKHYKQTDLSSAN